MGGADTVQAAADVAQAVAFCVMAIISVLKFFKVSVSKKPSRAQDAEEALSPEVPEFEIEADIDASGMESNPLFTSLVDSHRGTFAAGNKPAFTISGQVQDAVESIP